MKILFKQFFKTFFKKNIFLILGLSSLITVLSFTISTAINISQSFNYSLNNLNSQSNKADVVGNNLSNFGRIEFKEINDPNTQLVKTYTSSLSLHKDQNGVYSRKANSFFPYNKSDLKSRIGTEVNKLISINKNIIPNKNNLGQVFTLKTAPNGKAAWDFSYGLSVLMGPFHTSYNNDMAILSSFTDDQNNILLNPQQLLFNKSGIPFSLFANGNLSYSYNLGQTFGRINHAAKDPIFDPNTGFGIPDMIFNRATANPSSLHNITEPYIINIADFNTWNNDQNFHNYMFSRFIKLVEVKPIKIHVDLANSYGPISEFIKKDPQNFSLIFNKVFPINVNRQDGLKIDPTAVSNISIDQQQEYTIDLALPDTLFVDPLFVADPNQPNAQQANIEKNKKLFLSNFKIFLNNAFIKEAKNVFLEQLDNYLKQKNIQMVDQAEYYYSNPTINKEFLFVKKSPNDPNDKLFITQGSDLNSDDRLDLIKKDLNATYKDLRSRKTFYAFKELMDMIPESSLPKNIGTSILSNKYYLYWLTYYCLDNIVNQLKNEPTDEIPISVFNSQYMKLFTKLVNERFKLNFNTNNIASQFIFENNFTTLWTPANVNIPYLYNYLCVVNESFAIDNKKKYLPITTAQDIQELWIKKINEANLEKDPQLFFTNWINSIKNTSSMYLSFDFINEIFANNSSFFTIWLNTLSDDYKVRYNETSFLINGFGTSADYAYPVMSPTNPIPTPDNQGLVFINPSTFNSLGITDINISSYYTFSSANLSSNEIINIVKDYCLKNLNNDVFNIRLLNDAQQLGSVYIRTYFPNEIRNLIVIISALASFVLVILSFVVIYLLLSSFIKNLLEPISLTIANGISLKQIILAALANLSIVTVISNMVGFTAAFLSQTSFINLFSSVWMVPATSALAFTPLIFIPLILFTLLTFGGILTFLLYRKFKKPIPEVIANKNDIKNNKFTNFIRNSKIRIPMMFKLALGYSSINIGRLSLLGILGSLSLGLIVSSIIINDKFITSQNNTIKSRDYQYEYDLLNVNESTGLYKPQKFDQLGYEDQRVGINSLYLNQADHQKITDSETVAPYYKEMFAIKEIKEGGDETSIQIKPTNQYLSNMIYPSFYIYKKISAFNADAFFNGSASVFLLDADFTLLGQKINVWSFISPYFPTWLVSQLNSQALNFQNAIMRRYGEWYYKFIKLDPNKDKNLKYQIFDSVNNSLTIDNFNESKAGMYLAFSPHSTILGGKEYYVSKPNYVWLNSENKQDLQKYKSKPANVKSSQVVNENANLELTFDRNTDFYKKGSTTPTRLEPNQKVNWVFFPAFNAYHELLDNDKVVKNNTNPNKIRYSDDFINFIDVIYGDEIVSNQDSKISFGIIPFDQKIDQTFSLVKAKISNLRDEFGNEYIPKVSRISMYGIDPNSQLKFVKLENDNGKDLANLISTPTNDSGVINIIINNGSSLQYKLHVGSTFEANVSNNSLTQSYELMDNMLGTNNDRLGPRTSWKFKVVGICNDSFGERFYINQEDANVLLGLDKIGVYTKVSPNIVYEKPQFMPFNGIFTKNKDLLISKKSIPFYTFANVWNTLTNINQLTSSTYTNDKLLDFLLTHDEQLLKSISELINQRANTNAIDPNSTTLRTDILKYLTKTFSFGSSMQAINSIGQQSAIAAGLSGANSLEITNKMFNMISSLSTTVIIASVSVAIPLLLLVCLVTSLSMISDLNKNIGLMKMMGYSNRNILITMGIMFIPVLLTTLLLGLGIMFALTYGLQYLVFSLTSIFITPFVSPSVYFIGAAIVVVILGLSLSLIAYILKKKTLEYSIKF